MASAMIAQASDLRQPVSPGLERHHAGAAENQGREVASSASDNSRRRTPAKVKPRQTGASAKCPSPPFLRVRGSSPKAKTRQGLRKPPQAAPRARPEGRRPTAFMRRSELRKRRWRSLVIIMMKTEQRSSSHRSRRWTGLMTAPIRDDPFAVVEDVRVATVLRRLYSAANRQHLSIIRHFLPHAFPCASALRPLRGKRDGRVLCRQI